MQVSRFKSPFGEGLERHRVVVETEPCQKGTMHSRIVRQELLRYMSEDPFFSQCGGVDFHKARIWHDETRWFAEFEAIVPKPA